jgi:hypothetical protein
VGLLSSTSARLRFASTSDPAHGDAPSVTVRVSELKAAAGTPGDESGAGAPNGSSTSGPPDTDTATTTTPASEEGEAAGARGDMGDTQAPAVSAQEEGVGDDDGAEVETGTSGSAEASPATGLISPPSTDAATGKGPLLAESRAEA